MIDPASGQVDLMIDESEGGWLFNPRFSPDGSKIAVFWNRGSSRGIWVISRKTGERRPVYPGSHLPVGWTPDGRWICAAFPKRATLEIIGIDTETGNAKTVIDIPFDPEKGVPNHFGVGMTADGVRFVYDVERTLADVWLIEYFDPGIK
jgi:Tol biopolymer transport system component